jgi:hypothetical protein
LRGKFSNLLAKSTAEREGPLPLPTDDARVTRNGIALTGPFVILLSCQEVELGNIRQGGGRFRLLATLYSQPKFGMVA